jgi:hypothetical protein
MAVFLTPDDMASATASRKVRAGQLRRVARGIVTDDLDGPLEQVVARNLYELVGRLLRGAVISDRSARDGGQPIDAADGTRILYVTHPERRRDLELPGHLVAVRPGPGPVEGDAAYLHDGVSVASLARALVDNARESHARAGRPARTLSRYELEQWIDTLASDLTEDRFARLRNQVEQVAERLGEHDLGEVVSSLLGAAQSTRRDVNVSYPALVARRDGVPIDTRRLELFDQLVAALRDRAPEPMSTSAAGEARRAVLPFFEAYFSNFIEGTEFEVSEAAEIIFGGEIPQARPADAHDILGTYQLVSDPAEMATVPGGGERVLQLLRSRHATIMQARPNNRPGQFKTVANRVGSRVFVAPEEVIGTLQAGWERVRALDDPFARALAAMFVVSEVHPFDDGNGRVARVMMNAELVAAGQVRIVIPTVYRNNYLAALRGMSVNGRADGLIAVLAFAQRWTSQIDWSSVETAMGELEATQALRDATDAEAEGIRLQLPAHV